MLFLTMKSSTYGLLDTATNFDTTNLTLSAIDNRLTSTILASG